MTPEQYVQDKAARSGSSFYYAFLFLPPPRRAAITAFYAFCREVDDVVDEVSDPGVAATKLAWWRKETADSFAGRPTHPVTKALLPHAAAYSITPAHLNAVIDGCQIDLEQTRFLDFAGLARYCHLVAGVVGEVAANIFGRTSDSTTTYAHRLGLAMQLTNIIRDVGDDARRGRIYLPVSELQRFEVKASEILERSAPFGYSERFTALMKFQAERAHRCYDEALACLPDADRVAQKPGLMMANIYRTLLREIEADNFKVLHQRTSLHAPAQAVDRDAHELAGPMMQLAVVGGGWAGLAAAIEATQRGHAITLYEMAPRWGGRARRVDIDGDVLDNGQHIMIGAYRETLRLMQTVGVDLDQAFVRTPLRLTTPDGHGLHLPPGPPMLAFARGVLAQRGWTLAQRLSLLATAGGWALRGFRCDERLTVADLTAGLPAAVRLELVDPLCVAALNTPADSASASVFLRVIRDALFSGPGSADLLLPRQRLTELLPGPAVHWLAEHGASLRPGTRVERIERAEGGWSVDGARFDAVVLATTAVEAARLAKGVAEEWAASAAALRYEPIVTVYAESRDVRLPQPMLALPSDTSERPAQFVFDHGQLGGRPGLLAFVVSGAQPWLDRGLEATRVATLAQGEQQLGAFLRSPLQAIRVLTEKRATFRCVPSLRRPPGEIATGLHAAGDYVAGPYPATIEGAVRSAVQAVQRLDA